MHDVICPICGTSYQLAVQYSERDAKQCWKCGATGRISAVANWLRSYIFDNNLPLAMQEPVRGFKIIGLSDNNNYAFELDRLFDYKNTYIHQSPYLDITTPDAAFFSSTDVLISADVFEHVVGDLARAFHGAYALVKPGGCPVLTVPYINEGDHVEHFPDAIGYEATKGKDGKWRAILTRSDGSQFVEGRPRFHGGPGKTLEMRLFNRAEVERQLARAGFVEIEFHETNQPQNGICWGRPSRLVTARRPT